MGNEYIVTYTDHKDTHTKVIEAMTSDEAQVLLLASLPAGTILSMSARPKPRAEKRLYKISDLFH